jgi:hypothetical protein
MEAKVADLRFFHELKRRERALLRGQRRPVSSHGR